MRKKGDKNLDNAGVKEWLAKCKTKEGASGTRSNAHELYYLDKEPLEKATDFIVKHLSADFPQPKAVLYSKLFDMHYAPNKGAGKNRNRSKSSNSNNASASGNPAVKVRQPSGSSRQEVRRGRGALDLMPTKAVDKAEI